MRFGRFVHVPTLDHGDKTTGSHTWQWQEAGKVMGTLRIDLKYDYTNKKLCAHAEVRGSVPEDQVRRAMDAMFDVIRLSGGKNLKCERVDVDVPEVN